MNPVSTYAKAALVLLVVSFAAGGFGEAWVPSKLIVWSDAAATMRNIQTSDTLFRLGFIGYLFEATCDVSLALVFYMLLKPVRKDVALLSAFFGILATALFAVAELFYFAPSFILNGAGYLKTFTPDQLNSLAMLSLRFYSWGGGLFMAFYGTAWLLRAYLMFRSGYFPKAIAVLMGMAGLGFVLRNVALVLAPTYRSGWLLLLIMPGGLALMAWLGGQALKTKTPLDVPLT
jgi:Domain of unknown function (DUF4386)